MGGYLEKYLRENFMAKHIREGRCDICQHICTIEYECNSCYIHGPFPTPWSFHHTETTDGKFITVVWERYIEPHNAEHYVQKIVNHEPC